MPKLNLKPTKQTSPNSLTIIECKKNTSSHQLIDILKSHRKSLRISQDELAHLVNLNRQSISNIEREVVDPQLSNILEILKVCGITITVEYQRTANGSILSK